MNNKSSYLSVRLSKGVAMNKLLMPVIILAFIMELTACAYSRPNLPPRPEDGGAVGPSVLVESYKIAVGDQIQVNVWKNAELSLAVPVRPDGKISLPLIGDIMAVGYTPEELASRIEGKLTNYVKAPNVTVILTTLQGHQFLSAIRVTGSVAENRSITYTQGMTVLDAVLEAGSVDIYADSNNTKLHRRTKGGSVAYDVRLKDIMESGDMTTNILLLPGDIITVPERAF
jgi:polysaccharide export outer membrane protein